MTVHALASGEPRALLASDAGQPETRIADHPVWAAALAGTLGKPRLQRLLLAFYPAVAGPGRYAFAAKVSSIAPVDGKELFLQLHDTLKRPEANADEGWAKVLAALGASSREITQALREPSAEAEDLVDVIRTYGLRSSPVEASVIAFMLERQLPRLWGRLADSLEKRFGVPRTATHYLRYEHGRADDTERWVEHLVAAYVVPADPYEVYEGRRAAREAIWAWTALTESA
jgi:hypothetical protein